MVPRRWERTPCISAKPQTFEPHNTLTHTHTSMRQLLPFHPYPSPISTFHRLLFTILLPKGESPGEQRENGHDTLV